MIPLRKIFHYEKIITIDVLESVAKTIIFTGMIVGFAYATEFFIAWYSHNIVEVESFRWRAMGHYQLEFMIMVGCNTMVPLLFFIKRIRRAIPWLFGISLLVNVGMWYERFVIIIGGVAHGFIPHSWGTYTPVDDRVRDHVRRVLPVFLPVHAVCQAPAVGVHDGNGKNIPQRKENTMPLETNSSQAFVMGFVRRGGPRGFHDKGNQEIPVEAREGAHPDSEPQSARRHGHEKKQGWGISPWRAASSVFYAVSPSPFSLRPAGT